MHLLKIFLFGAVYAAHFKGCDSCRLLDEFLRKCRTNGLDTLLSKLRETWSTEGCGRIL